MRFATKLLLLRHHCHRRLLPLSSAAASSSSISSALSPNPISPNPNLQPFPSSSRSFSWFGWSRPSDSGGPVPAEDDGNDHNSDTANTSSLLEGFESVPASSPPVHSAGGAWPSDLVQDVGGDGGSLGMVDELVGDGSWVYPVHGVISVLDGYHDLTGLPWWAVISTSTVALRFTLLPVLILQLRKGQEIASFFPK